MATKPDEFIPTRASLLSRLKSWDNEESWRDFFNTYWKLIYSVALRRGLTEQEAQDVVQETIISVAKTMAGFQYNPAKCSFKGWLRHLTEKRIVDQFRKRRNLAVTSELGAAPGEDEDAVATDQLPDPSHSALDELWEEEWRRSLLQAAIDNVKKQVSPRQFKIFHRCVVEDHPAREVANTFEINIAQVYLAKHRVSALVKKEVRRLEAKTS